MRAEEGSDFSSARSSSKTSVSWGSLRRGARHSSGRPCFWLHTLPTAMAMARAMVGFAYSARRCVREPGCLGCSGALGFGVEEGPAGEAEGA